MWKTFPHMTFIYYRPAALIEAFNFSTSKSTSMPCTIAASSRDSICEAGQPRQCIPISIKMLSAPGKICSNSPILVVLETCDILFSSFFYWCSLLYILFFYCAISEFNFLNFFDNFIQFLTT